MQSNGSAVQPAVPPTPKSTRQDAHRRRGAPAAPLSCHNISSTNCNDAHQIVCCKLSSASSEQSACAFNPLGQQCMVLKVLRMRCACSAPHPPVCLLSTISNGVLVQHGFLQSTTTCGVLAQHRHSKELTVSMGQPSGGQHNPNHPAHKPSSFQWACLASDISQATQYCQACLSCPSHTPAARRVARPTL